MRHRESSREAQPQPRLTRIVPAIAPHASTASLPRLRTAAHAPNATAFQSTPAEHRHGEADGQRSITSGVERRETAAPRTLGDTAARRAIVADPRSRSTTAARRLRPGDSALVTATTQLLAVVESEVEERALVPLASEVGLAVRAGREHVREPVTIVAPAASPALSPLIRLGAPAPHPHPRARRARMAVLTIVLTACMLLAIRFALPLTRDTSSPASYTSHLPAIVGGQLVPPSGPWSTGTGVADTLGLGGGAAPGVKAPGSAGAAVSKQQPAKPSSGASSNGGSSGVLPAPLYPWPPSDPFMYVPGHPSFGMSDVGGFYYWAFGQCTWWAQYKKQNENLTHMGSALYWAAGAASRGYRIGSWPVAGATVVFQPGVQGAGGYGHVAHVEAVYPDGWFLVSEMNFYANGGGWGRVDYRYAHSGWGVSFIY